MQSAACLLNCPSVFHADVHAYAPEMRHRQSAHLPLVNRYVNVIKTCRYQFRARGRVNDRLGRVFIRLSSVSQWECPAKRAEGDSELHYIFRMAQVQDC